MNLYKNNDTILAGFSVRALAYIIDLFIVLIIQGIISLILLIINIFTNGILYEPLLFKYSASNIILYLASAVYFIFTTYSSGATLGKSLMKIKVVNIEDKPLNFIDILYRETIGRYLSSIFCVGYLMVACSKDNAALHDKLCKTRVIYTNNAFKIISTEEIIDKKSSFELEAYTQVQEEQNIKTFISSENNEQNTEIISETNETTEDAEKD